MKWVIRIIFLFFILVAVPHSFAETFDSKSLIGEWWCDWKATQFLSIQGKVYITVTAVEDSKVRGEVEVTGSRFVFGKKKFEGTLNGNTLSIFLENISMELAVEGKEMRGVGYGTMRNDIACLKRR